MARVAFIIDEMFEDSEFRVPYDRLRRAGHEVVVIGREAGKSINGKSGKERVTTAVAIRDVTADEFDALVVPGGYSPDHLRMDPLMVDFTRRSSRPSLSRRSVTPARCSWRRHRRGPDATSWPSIRTDPLTRARTGSTRPSSRMPPHHLAAPGRFERLQRRDSCASSRAAYPSASRRSCRPRVSPANRRFIDPRARRGRRASSRADCARRGSCTPFHHANGHQNGRQGCVARSARRGAQATIFRR